MALSIIRQYQQLLQHIPQLIEISGYRTDYVVRKMGLQLATFSAKKQRGNWTADEVAKLITIIDNEDVDDYLMVQMMRDLTRRRDHFLHRPQEGNGMELILKKQFIKQLKILPS